MADIMTLITALPERLPPDPEREWKIAHTVKVARPITEVGGNVDLVTFGQ
jgi:hypothetical protein